MRGRLTRFRVCHSRLRKGRRQMSAAGRFGGGVGFAAALVFLLSACGGGNKVAAASLEPRLLPASSVPGSTR